MLYRCVAQALEYLLGVVKGSLPPCANSERMYYAHLRMCVNKEHCVWNALETCEMMCCLALNV